MPLHSEMSALGIGMSQGDRPPHRRHCSCNALVTTGRAKFQIPTFLFCSRSPIDFLSRLI